MKRIGKVIDKVIDKFTFVSVGCIAFIMIINVIDVVLAKLTGRSITGVYEICECILLCAVFSSFAYGQIRKSHVHVTLLLNKFPGRLKFIVYFITELLSFALGCILTYAMFYQAATIMEKGSTTGVLLIPIYPFYYFAAICMVIFMLTMLYDLALSFLSIFKDEYGEMIKKNW